VGVAEQDRRDHAVLQGDDIGVLPELPQKGADAHAEQPVSDDRRLLDRIVVIERQSEDHARLLASPPARLARPIMRDNDNAVAIPASSTTGTVLRLQISSIAVGLAMPMPEPISDPSGITAAQPTSTSFWQETGSSLQ